MKFIEREVQYPKRRKITKLDENFDEITETAEYFNVENVEEPEEVIEEGTLLSKELLEKGNWHDDKVLTFTAMEIGDLEPEPEENLTQIFTNALGKTWLVPPGLNGERVQLGKTVGTTVIEGGIEKDVWDADTKQATLTPQQIQNIADIATHVANFNNPHQVSKTQMGISNVDNTSDINKPISTATQAALNTKQNTITPNTAFNKNYSTAMPLMDGVGSVSVGNSDTVARGDHRHPTDTTKSDVASTRTGTVRVYGNQSTANSGPFYVNLGNGLRFAYGIKASGSSAPSVSLAGFSEIFSVITSPQTNADGSLVRFCVTSISNTGTGFSVSTGWGNGCNWSYLAIGTAS